MAQETQIRSVEEEEQRPTTTAAVSSSSVPQKESEVTLSVKSLQEESLQISELSEMERTYAVEVISAMKQIVEPLNVSYHIRPQSVAKSDSSLTDVILTPQGVVCLVHNNGTINSKALESLQSETLVKILLEIIPEVKSLLIERRQKISGRVGMLEKVAREFRKVSTTLPGRDKRSNEQQLQQQQIVLTQGMTQKEKAVTSHTSDALKVALTGQ